MKEKTKGLWVNLALYLAAFAIGLVPFAFIDNLFRAEAALTFTATFVIYIVSCFIPDTSLYDPYWSVAPPVMLLAAMIKYGYWSANSVILLAAVFIWALRLTGNWAYTYKGLCREDWRYAVLREKYPPFVFALINFFGLQMLQSFNVYAGLMGAFFILQKGGFTPMMLVGIAMMLLAVALELAADTAIHRFLRENAGSGRTCDISVWRYSRHPNYLGEMCFWAGMFCAFAAVRPDIWYAGLGFLLIELQFRFISAPMMERHNLERRADYAEYQEKTSMLLLLPPRKN